MTERCRILRRAAFDALVLCSTCKPNATSKNTSWRRPSRQRVIYHPPPGRSNGQCEAGLQWQVLCYLVEDGILSAYKGSRSRPVSTLAFLLPTPIDEPKLSQVGRHDWFISFKQNVKREPRNVGWFVKWDWGERRRRRKGNTGKEARTKGNRKEAIPVDFKNDLAFDIWPKFKASPFISSIPEDDCWNSQTPGVCFVRS